MSFEATIYPWNQSQWQTLSRDYERSNHALLLHGGRGIGKVELALSLAHHVITARNAQSAFLFDAGNHPDFYVLMPEDHLQENWLANYAQRSMLSHSGKPKSVITIEQIRAMTSMLDTHPHISDTRVILILAAHKMNRNAANALLKCLEEPPANTLFLLVSDDISLLAKTVKSRCSHVGLAAPDSKTAEQWLLKQGVMPAEHVASHLAMANNQPLLAIEYFKEHYVESLKSVFTDVNNLWAHRGDISTAAKNWQSIGAQKCLDMLQKLVVDLLRCKLADPITIFYPVQRTWLQSVAKKLSLDRLIAVNDELIYAKKMLLTTVDELLVLETVSIKLQALPE